MACDYETWKEVQENEIEYWEVHLFEELKDVANVEDFIKDWEDLKSQIQGNTEIQEVEEDFTYNEEEWLNEIYEEIKPLVVRWLEDLSKDEEIDFSDYIKNFW